MDHRSIWQKTSSNPTHFSPLKTDLYCDAVVVGAGLTGILTAWMLQKHGLDVIVLDSSEPGQGTTAQSTAKITAMHGFFYSDLISSHGIEFAKQYFRANQLAIERYSDFIRANNISCDFQNVNCLLYSNSSSTRIQKELSALKVIGASPNLTTKTQLPFSITSALKIKNQAIFHPLKFQFVLASRLRIFSNSTVRKIIADKAITDHACVTARHIIITTRYPFMLSPGLFFSRMHQERSYALSITNIQPMDDMYISMDKKGITFRPWNDQVILSGFSHRTGHVPTQNGYDALHLCAQRWYPGCNYTAQWSAEDCIPADRIPYVGSYKHGTAQLHIATGFQKWGISSAMVAAEILTDSVCGRKNPFTSVFSSHRFPDANAIGRILCDGAISTTNLAKQIFYIPKAKLQQIEPGQGGIIQWNGTKAGVFHHKNGNYYFVSTRCPHMGCQLNWNPAEHTWDCPCHGSRFHYNGTRLDSPANQDLPCECLKK